ncbi:SPOR domain-containing protein [Treponema sp. TIM-1]|uniref:SPOR domain-containing protein n=1 Tax=Treponema sp. TIM-1 TaxID=2898417 RepID=UPI00397EA474
MKKIRMTIGIMVASVFFIGASIWEGAAVAAPGNELPQEGYFAATNSFPPNTVVYMTNLESGKTIQAVITSPLDSPVLLAMLSRDAAQAIDIQDQSITRIRIIQPGEPAIASHFAESIYPEGTAITKGPEQDQGFLLLSPTIQDKATDVPIPEELAAGAYSWYEDLPETGTTVPQPEAGNPGTLGGYDLSLIPAEERPPTEITNSWRLPPEAEITALDSSFSESSTEAAAIDPSLIIPSWEDREPAASPIQQASAQHGESLLFSVPVISSLEKGKYYLQLRAFGQIELVEAELSRIGKNYPLVIQPSEGSNGSVYRILLGPVGLGESGALLQRFKSIGYGDAFIRQGIY